MMPTSAPVRLVREEDHEAIRDEIAAVMSATRAKPARAERFAWLYGANPAGAAIVWTVRDEATNEIAGFTACLPRRMLVGGESKTAWIGSDFSVLPAYRSLGPAVTLRRAAKTALDACEADFLYAHPNERMAVVHKRVGHRQVGMMRRYAVPLTLRPILSERAAVAGHVAGWSIDPARRLLAAATGDRSVRFVEEAAFDDRHTRLFEETVPGGVVGVRDAPYLDWRYVQNPLQRHSTLEAYEADRLVGWLVLTLETDALVVKDLWPAANEKVAARLLAAAVRWGRRRRLRSLTITALDAYPAESVMRRLGLRPRAETSDMFAYFPDGEPPPVGEWTIASGDRDV